MNLGNVGASSQYNNTLNYGGNTYRSWLQNIANSHGGVVGQEASALLQVVGDDARINDHFMSDPYGYTGTDRGQVFSTTGAEGQNVGYGPQGLSRINSIFSNYYGKRGQNDVPGGPVGVGGSGGGDGGTRSNKEDLAYLDQQRSLYERLLGDVDKYQKSGLKELANSYTREKNTANTQRSRALEDFQTQRYDSERGKQSALNAVDRNTRTLSDSLRQILGMASGPGSSAFLYAAPQAVARLASGERGEVMSNFGENERSLVTAEKRAKSDFEQLLEDLAIQNTKNKQRLLTGLDTQRQEINQSLAQIAADRAAAMGGSALDAMAPYRSAYMTLQDRITNYPNQFKTSVTPRGVKVDPVNLRDYVVDRQAINANRQGGQSNYSPYAQFLNRQREEDERLI